MPKGPAARVTDPVIHPLPGLLTPGPGSPNVLIGSLPAWRGVPAGGAAAIQAARKVSDAAIAVAEAATAVAAGTPGSPAAKAAEETVKATAASMMGSMISGAAGGADIHSCLTPLPIPPHGPGVVIDGSPTVLINNLPACRQGDTIIEAVGPPDKIAMGLPTVIIGNSSGAASSSSGSRLAAIADSVNPLNGGDNCGYIIDAVHARLTGSDPKATAPDEEDGSWEAIEDRFGTKFKSGESFSSAFDAVKAGGTGTMALVGMDFSDGQAHIVMLANDNGTVGVIEGQGGGDVFTSADQANAEYNKDGKTAVKYGILPDKFK